MSVQRFENSKIVVLITVLQKHICVLALVLLVCVTLDSCVACSV